MNGHSKFNKLVEIARALAPNPREDIRNHHVTFMLRKNRVVSIGVNSSKTNTKNLKYRYVNRQNVHIGNTTGTHSEMSCVLKYGREDCSDITFVNIRIDRNGKLNNSKPCSGCASLLQKLGFKKLFYSNMQSQFQEWL